MERPWKILLVDDDPDFLYAARRVLGKRASVETAQAPSEALRIIDESLFDAVVADYRMEPTDGAKLLKEVGSHNPDLKRVLLTAFDEEALSERGFHKTDVDLVLDKNDPLSVLDKKLTSFLESTGHHPHERRPRGPT